MSWGNTIFSTTTTIAKWEQEINDLTSSDWNDKIDLAKTIMGSDVELRLLKTGFGKYIDFKAGEDVKDLITNPEIFNLASDFKTLQLIYEDLAKGDTDSYFWVKSRLYKTRYDEELNRVWALKNMDYDQDEEVDEYKNDTFAAGGFTR